MNLCLWTVLCLLQWQATTGNLYQIDLREFLDSIDELPSDAFPPKDADPNDRVDVKLWNQLNEEDMKNMPQIEDYSNEQTAVQWLKWYSRVALRYSQVNTDEKRFSIRLLARVCLG